MIVFMSKLKLGAWGEELLIKESMRALASIAFKVKWYWRWEADPEVGSSNPGEYEIIRKKVKPAVH